MRLSSAHRWVSREPVSSILGSNRRAAFPYAVYLKSENGVVIKLVATDVGLKFKLSADGVHVDLKS
jgi:hypothetical protein